MPGEEKICYNCFSEKDASGACPKCGFSEEQDAGKYAMALPYGSILNGRYIIGRVLGQGGFGITYMAYDQKENERVAVKEFLPTGISMRAKNNIYVSTIIGSDTEAFNSGLNSFIEEARVLAKFEKVQNVVKIHECFRENNTAYFAMDYVEGVSLKEYLKSKGGKVSWQEAVRLILPITTALITIHKSGVIHRDITPDNIYISENEEVKLLDFGSAKHSMGDKTMTMAVVLKHGYAPPEQYRRRSRQGPYTDIYSLAATLYNMLTGLVPPDSIERDENDELTPPRKCCPDMPQALEAVILRGMAVNPADRYQSAESFRDALAEAVSGEEPSEGKQKKRIVPIAAGAAAVVAAVVIIIAAVSMSAPTETVMGEDVTEATEATEDESSADQGNKKQNLWVLNNCIKQAKTKIEELSGNVDFAVSDYPKYEAAANAAEEAVEQLNKYVETYSSLSGTEEDFNTAQDYYNNEVKAALTTMEEQLNAAKTAEANKAAKRDDTTPKQPSYPGNTVVQDDKGDTVQEKEEQSNEEEQEDNDGGGGESEQFKEEEITWIN